MATDKKSFLLYCDLIHTVNHLPDEAAGQLFKHILSYVNDEKPISPHILVNLAFEPVKQQLKRDLRNWEEEKINKSTGGQAGNLKRWHPDLYKQLIDNEIDLEKALSVAKDRRTSHTDNERSQNIASVAVTVNDTVNVTVTDNEIKKKREKKTFLPPSEIEVVEYFIENGYKSEAATKAYKYYETGSWIDSKGNPVKNWKQKMQSVWFKDEFKTTTTQVKYPAHASNPIG